jgi:hypothetical protein
MAKVFRSDQVAIHVNVTGVALDNTSWDSFEGGEVKVDNLKVFPGGMQPQLALGGIPKWEDVIIHRLWSDTLIALYKELANRAGNTPMEASYTVLETTGVATPNVFSYKGVLLDVTRPNYKSGTSEEAMLTLTMGLNAGVT